MAGNIKGITIEFRGDTTKLQSAMRTLNSEISKTSNELKSVNNALKFNPGNTTLLAQKQELLKQRIAETREKADALKQSLAQMDASGVSKTSEEYRKTQREIIECESKMKNFNAELLKTKAAASSLGQLGTKFDEVGKKITSAGQSMRTLSMYSAAVAGAIGALAYKSGVAADDINTLSKVTGIGTDKLQLYAQASDLVDVSVSAIAKSSTRMKKNMLTASQGTGDAAKAFDKLGVSVADSEGNLRDQDAVFQETLKALGSMENETERDALAMQIFGKSATELNPLIEDCGETYSKVMQTFKENKIDIVDQKTLDKANEFNDSIDMIKATWSQATMVIGTKLAGYLAPIMENIQKKLSAIAGKIANSSPKILAIVGAIAGVVGALAPVLIVVGKISSAVGGLFTKVSQLITKFGGLGKVFSALKANPLILVATAFALMYAKSEDFRKAIEILVKSLKSALMPIFKALEPAISAIASVVGALAQVFGDILAPIIKIVADRVSAMTPTFTRLAKTIANVFTGISKPILAVVGIIEKAIAKIKNIINNAKLQLPKFKLPHFVIKGGKIPWGIGGEGVKPTIDVKWYKQGGIFDRPSIVGLGEAGKEAIVPLSGKQMEPFAKAIAENFNGGGNTYNFGNITIDASSLQDIATVEDFALMLKRAKAFA